MDTETAPLDRPSPDPTAFPWDDLPSLEAADAEITNRLLDLLPLGDGHSTLDSLGDLLGDLVGVSHTLDFHRLRARDGSPPTFGDAFVTRFHLPPDPETGALSLDRSLVDRWLAELRDRSPDIRVAGDLDHRDFGLATYLVVRTFDWLKAERGAPPVVFPTEPPLRETLRERLDDADRLVEATYVVTTDRNRHLARLLIPGGLVRNTELFHSGAPGRRALASELIDGPIADLDIDLPVTLGRTDLVAETLATLAPGDVVLFDEHGYAPEGDAPATAPAARLQLADGGAAHLDGYAVPGTSHWQFHPIDLTPRTDAEEPDPVEQTTDFPDDSRADDAPDDDADPGPTELLETPEIRLEARLGSTTLTVGELGRMQPGQVLTLDARVGQPVDLVVDGRKVGEGELVDVEGRLGVRVRRTDR